MKIYDLETVNRLVRVRERCTKALNDIEAFEDAIIKNGHDAGGVPGYDIGYNAHISQYDDGSGTSIDLSGCYLGKQVAEATRVLLVKQIAAATADLSRLGVEEEEDDFLLNRSPASS